MASLNFSFQDCLSFLNIEGIFNFAQRLKRGKESFMFLNLWNEIKLIFLQENFLLTDLLTLFVRAHKGFESSDFERSFGFLDVSKTNFSILSKKKIQKGGKTKTLCFQK